ncbi:PAS domain-containing hybrid sensor histidine kinase/response regulator [Spirosoma fluviale]|uniref:Sensory/regulatory protein RpfC n=1 Tax=Spirosoma fluviale TaxID=1597977 RepID=A0A286GIC5_9BACT|nr:PAS domain S-box protein [Spirosoma fluviale]SOD94724.1 PAS domain S-box-containing protein [Spirosoma fluviale]
MEEDIDLLRRKLVREKTARLQAEAILEKKALALYNANEQLLHLNENLEQQIRDKLAELRESEQRYRQLIESVQDIIYKISPEGFFTFVSPVVEKLLGYTEEEFLSSHFTSVVQLGYRKRLINFYRTMMSERQDSTYNEFPVVAKDGRTVWIGQTVRLIEANGQIQELVAVARDISDRKLAEIELETTQTRLSTLITNLQSGVMVEDEYGRVILANQLFCDIFQLPLSPDQLIGHDGMETRQQVKPLFVHPECFTDRMNELLLSREACVGEEISMVSGRILELDYIPIFLDANQYMGHLWRYTDVTEKYMARELIRRSEEKYRGIMNNMELGLFEVDNDQIIVRAYERCCQMLGYSEDEMVGKNATDLLVPAEFVEIVERQQQERQQGIAGSYELQLVKKDGSRIWVLVSGVPILDEHGTVVGSMGIHYDMNERKQLEHELARAKQYAEEAQQAEKQFFANMSHEIRTPLNAIIGMSHLLYDTQPTAQQREYINILKTSADFLHSLISDLLDMTKIEAGRIEIHARPFDLAGLLRSTQKVFEMKLQGRPISIDILLDTRITNTFIGDDVMLNQIMMNLVGNAEKFTEEGQIQIIGKVKKEEDDKSWIEFIVSDTGVGIPADKVDLVFQKFKQVNPQGYKHKGTGLGLAITKELVELQGGNISVKSQEGVGSTFTFVIPYTKSKVQVEPKNNVDKQLVMAEELKTCSVLVVEDNLMNQTYIGSLLNKWNVPYIMASDGKQAVEQAKKQPFDIVLMDIQMPIMNGYEATVAIRSTQNPNQHAPIIALTASAMLDHKSIAMEAGMSDFLTKPFEPAQLLSILQRFAPAAAIDSEGCLLFNKALDRKRLSDLYGTDAAYASEMFSLFLSDVVPDIRTLPHLCTTQDWAVLANAAHRLKPTLAMVGLSTLEEKMRQLEKRARQDADKSGLEVDCRTFVDELDKMLPILETELQMLSQL